jgi:4-amino-4-deoxy-L-arabinose transferase-like glycosyltransferase
MARRLTDEMAYFGPQHRLWSAPILWGVLFAAFGIRALLFPFNENLYGDAVIRTELALKWLRNPHWISSFDDGAFQFGPLHLYLVGLFQQIWPDKEYSGRFLSLVVGTLTVIPLFSLTRRLFGERSAVWACVAFSLWGIHLQLSTTAASEALGLFLVIFSLAFFARFWEEHDWPSLVGAALVSNLACATRYDAWMLVPLLCVALFLRPGISRKRALVDAVLFGLLCLPFPLVWMYGNYAARGDALWPIRYIDQFHANWFGQETKHWGGLEYRLMNLLFWPGAALFTLTPLVAGFGFVGLVRGYRKHPNCRWLVWLIAMPTLYFTVRAVAGTFVPLARFTVVQVALLLPFAYLGFEAVTQRIQKQQKSIAIATAALAVGMPMWLGALTFQREGKFANALRPVSPVSTNLTPVRQVIEFLKGFVAPSGLGVILDSDPHYSDLQLAFFAGMGEDRIARHRWDTFRLRLTDTEPGFLVLIDGGRLSSEPDFELKGRVAQLAGMRFIEIEGFSPPYRVFRRR